VAIDFSVLPAFSDPFRRNGRSDHEVTRLMSLIKKDARKVQKLAQALASLSR
jgi:hypothetical protein